MKTFSNYIPCKKNTESLLILYTELFFLDTERYKSNRYKSGNLYDHWILLDFCDLLILNFSYVVTKNILIPYRTKKSIILLQSDVLARNIARNYLIQSCVSQSYIHRKLSLKIPFYQYEFSFVYMQILSILNILFFFLNMDS